MTDSARLFRAVIEYDGTDFAGFQYQVGERTVQGALEDALEVRTGQRIRITGAGRTDAGVHAAGQVISFRVETAIPLERMARALNTALPADVRVLSVLSAEEGFSARFSASSRTYGYLILNRSAPSALLRRYSVHRSDALDVQAMKAAAAYLPGERDFAAFTNELQPDEPTMRDVRYCRLIRRGGLLVILIEANAFLRGMVRTAVGTLMDVGGGKRSPEDVPLILASRDRKNAGPSAPARGLCLLKVKYGERKEYPRHYLKP